MVRFVPLALFVCSVYGYSKSSPHFKIDLLTKIKRKPTAIGKRNFSQSFSRITSYGSCAWYTMLIYYFDNKLRKILQITDSEHSIKLKFNLPNSNFQERLLYKI